MMMVPSAIPSQTTSSNRRQRNASGSIGFRDFVQPPSNQGFAALREPNQGTLNSWTSWPPSSSHLHTELDSSAPPFNPTQRLNVPEPPTQGPTLRHRSFSGPDMRSSFDQGPKVFEVNPNGSSMMRYPNPLDSQSTVFSDDRFIPNWALESQSSRGQLPVSSMPIPSTPMKPVLRKTSLLPPASDSSSMNPKRPAFPSSPSRFVAKQLKQGSRQHSSFGELSFSKPLVRPKLKADPIGVFVWGFSDSIKVKDIMDEMYCFGEMINGSCHHLTLSWY
jgi:hypothetical protein